MRISNSIAINNNPTAALGGGWTNQYALQTDGVDETVSTTNFVALQGVTNFTVSGWVKQNTNTGFGLFERFISSTDATWPVYYDGTKIQILLYNGSASKGEFAFTWTLDTWINVVVAYDGAGATNADKVKLWINGSAKTLTFTGTIQGTTKNVAGSYNIISDNIFLDGVSDELAVFDYTVTHDQAVSIYNAGVAPDLLNTSGLTAPIHLYRWTEADTHATVNDEGTTGSNDGTGVNTDIGDKITDTP